MCFGTALPVDENVLQHVIGRFSQKLTGHRLILVVLIPHNDTQDTCCLFQTLFQIELLSPVNIFSYHILVKFPQLTGKQNRPISVVIDLQCVTCLTNHSVQVTILINDSSLRLTVH